MSLHDKSEEQLYRMYNSLSPGRTATKIMLGAAIAMLVVCLLAGAGIGAVLVVGIISIPAILLWHKSICKKCDAIVDELNNREQAKENEKKKKQEALYDTMRKGTWAFPVEKFSKQCYDAQIFDIDSEYNLQKAKAIAQNILKKCNVPADAQAGYLTTEKIREYFVGTTAFIDEKENNRLKAVRKEEKERQKELTKYAEHIGRDKWIDMIKEPLLPLRKSEREREHAVDSARKLSHMPTESASQRRYWADMVIKLSLSGDSVKLKALEEELQKAETAAISDLPEQDIFQKLSIDSSFTITETGAISIVAKVGLAEPIKIFGDIPTKVDGTIAANIYKGNRKMGTALLVLPRQGVSYDPKASPTEVQGLYLGKADPNETYTLRFAPHHLWVMEA